MTRSILLAFSFGLSVTGCKHERAPTPSPPPSAPPVAVTAPPPLASVDPPRDASSAAAAEPVDGGGTLKETCSVAAQLPTPRYGLTATALEGGIVLVAGGGQQERGPWLRDVDILDVKSRTLAKGPPLGEGRMMHVAVSIGARGVAFVGGHAKTAERYDAETKTLSTLGEIEADGIGMVGIPNGKTAFVAGGEVIWKGGDSKAIYEVGPTAITRVGDLPVGISSAHVIRLDDGRSLLVTMSIDMATNRLVPFQQVVLFDPKAKKGTAASKGMEARLRSWEARPQTAGILLFAEDRLVTADAVYVFGGAKPRWTKVASLVERHAEGAAAFVSANTVVVAGGLGTKAVPEGAVEICTF